MIKRTNLYRIYGDQTSTVVYGNLIVASTAEEALRVYKKEISSVEAKSYEIVFLGFCDLQTPEEKTECTCSIEKSWWCKVHST